MGEQPPPEAVVQKVALNIEPQPVGEALNELGRQTGLVIIVYSAVGRGVSAPRITGKLTPEHALDQILANTGLRYEYLDAKTVAVLSSQTDIRHAKPARDGDTAKVAPKQRGDPSRGAGVPPPNESVTQRDTRTQQPPPRERSAPRETRADHGSRKDTTHSAVEAAPQ